MSVIYRIRRLCEEEWTSIAQMERDLGFSNGSVSKWDTSSPSGDKLKKVADYFNTTTDYLLGKVPFRNLKEERHSVIVATMRQILSGYDADAEEIFYKSLRSIRNNIVHKTDRFSLQSLLYIEKLTDKLDRTGLTDIEIFDVANFAMNRITWPKDYRGPVTVTYRDKKEVAILFDYWTIPQITLDESKSKLVYANEKQDFAVQDFETQNSIGFHQPTPPVSEQKDLPRIPEKLLALISDMDPLPEDDKEDLFQRIEKDIALYKRSSMRLNGGDDNK